MTWWPILVDYRSTATATRAWTTAQSIWSRGEKSELIGGDDHNEGDVNNCSGPNEIWNADGILSPGVDLNSHWRTAHPQNVTVQAATIAALFMGSHQYHLSMETFFSSWSSQLLFYSLSCSLPTITYQFVFWRYCIYCYLSWYSIFFTYIDIAISPCATLICTYFDFLDIVVYLPKALLICYLFFIFWLEGLPLFW